MNQTSSSTSRTALLAVGAHIAIVIGAVAAGSKLSSGITDTASTVMRYAFIAYSMVSMARFIIAFRAGAPASERSPHSMSAVGALLIALAIGGTPQPLAHGIAGIGLVCLLIGTVGATRTRATQAE